MALYRCAMCGSSKITTEIKREGYNKKKGIRGAIIFGGLGALAGTDGNKMTYYHCGDCGQVLNHTMPENVKFDIDMALTNPSKNENSLKRYKSQYKNIEWEEQQQEESLSPFASAIVEYMKKCGPIVKIALDNMGEWLTEMIGVDESNASLSYSAIDELLDKGIIDFYKLPDGEEEDENGVLYLGYILITDIEERKKLAREREIANKEREQKTQKSENEEEEIRNHAKRLAATVDLSAKVEEALLNNSMESDEIYEYLRENNYLSEEILNAEKKAEESITYYDGNHGFVFRLEFVSSYLSELIEQEVVGPGEGCKYRIIKHEEKEAERLAEIGNYTPILQNALSKTPMTPEEIYKYLEENDYLPQYVIKAAKSNAEIPKCFVYKCLNLMGQRDRIRTYYDDGKYSV